MSLLTDEELRDALRSCPPDAIEALRNRWLYAKDFASAIEKALIRKLATVSVEPMAWMFQHTDTGRVTFLQKAEGFSDRDKFLEANPRWQYVCDAHTDTQLAAARVQALEEAAKVCEGQATIEGIAQTCAYEIRALIGGTNDHPVLDQG